MGYLQASEMLEYAGFDTALHWHMASNLYPPPPTEFIPVARQAIQAVNEGDPTRRIPHKGRTAEARDIVDAFRLDAFCREA